VPRDLHGARVLITGASSGVGVAAARTFARAGADVALLARSRRGLERSAALARAEGRRALVLPADVTDAGAVDAAVARAEDELGGLDVVVCNHAAVAFGPFTRMAKADFDRVVEVTFIGMTNVIRAALPALERTAGTIVVTGSINSRAPLPAFSPYAAAKHALRGFLRTLSVELRAQGSPVRIARLDPGAIDTPVWRSVTSATGRLPRVPPEGYRPEAVADALVALARRPRGEVTLGLEAKAFEWLWRAPLIGGPILRLVYRWYLSGRKPATGDPLWQPAGEGRADGPLLGRPSLLGLVRRRLRR
jgi:NAD(P)-dependent dehydrogenase (short-subunit alcohol dehydrogenase family)